MWILIIKVNFQGTKLNLFLGKNRKLELQNEKNQKGYYLQAAGQGGWGNMNLLPVQAFLGC